MNEALKSLTISADVSIRSALGAIDHSKRQIALVVDIDGKLLATVTDGDVRRGILSGVDPDGPVSQVMLDLGQVNDLEATRSEFYSVFKG